MSRRQDLQSADGVALFDSGYGELQHYSKVAPVNGLVGYSPGCEWFNQVATVNGFSWLNVGGNGFGSNPTSLWIDQSAGNGMFGGGGIVYRGAGNFGLQISSAGKQPSATAVFKIFDVFIFPANTLDIAGRGISMNAWGTFGATGNTKQLQWIFGITNTTPITVDGSVTVTGGTAIGDTGAVTTNGGGWQLQAQIYKYGAAGSNTQQSLTTGIILNTAHAGMGSPANQTFTENSQLILAICGKATTATTDITYSGSQVEVYN